MTIDIEKTALLDHLQEIGQLKKILTHPAFSEKQFEEILFNLLPVHSFYKEMGGLAGYHKKILTLLKKTEVNAENLSFHSPSFIDISNLDSETKQAIEFGIEALPFMAEMIPLGGAADRLHLHDEKTGSELPAAKLMFAGKSLLERLIMDVQARENLYFERYGIKIITPIALMTSHEKNNHFHVEKSLEESNWYGRPKDSIRIFTQNLVPAVDENGDFLLTPDFKLVMKPGGHGAIWKLALDTGIFSWFKEQNRTKVLVRQINNPIAGLDYGLLAFLGIGWKKNKKFGFASCPRLLKAAEGMNVTIEKKETIVLTNVEYCDFEKFGIEDRPLKEGDAFSRFSSNTNLLFGDISSISEAVQKSPFPGLLLNMKKGSLGSGKEAFFGRLESTMQNLADVFVEKKKDTLVPESTFITYNHRHKTISTTKRAYVEGGILQETPENCFYDLMIAARELLTLCGISLPASRTLVDTLKTHPEFVFLYHPILGPLYSIIQQKIRNGTFKDGSELNLEIKDPLIENISLDGSLKIQGEEGSCILKNVKIHNRGIDWDHSRPFWKGQFARKESLEIVLKGNARFSAENVVLEGNRRFVVEDGCYLKITQDREENGYLRAL